MTGHNAARSSASSSASLGLVFGLVVAKQLKALPVHRSMLEISELIYETAQDLPRHPGQVHRDPVGVHRGDHRRLLRLPHHRAGRQPRDGRGAGRDHPGLQPRRHPRLLRRRLVRHPREHLREQPLRLRRRWAASPSPPTPSRSRPACRSARCSSASSCSSCCASSSSSPRDLAGPCFIGFAIGESLGASALRIAGGIFTKIADIGSDLMKIVFKIKEDDARNPGVIADCTGDNAGDSVGPSADGFETYGVTGVALITFILLAVVEPARPGAAARLDLRDAHHDGHRVGRSRTGSTRRWRRPSTSNADHMNFEAPLTILVWLTSIVSVVLTYLVSNLLIARPRRRHACGGSSPPSSPAARSPARSSPR